MLLFLFLYLYSIAISLLLLLLGGGVRHSTLTLNLALAHLVFGALGTATKNTVLYGAAVNTVLRLTAGVRFYNTARLRYGATDAAMLLINTVLHCYCATGAMVVQCYGATVRCHEWCQYA
jgi:hypothetical protein